MDFEIKPMQGGEIVPSKLISLSEFIQITACNEETINDLLDLGWLAPSRSGSDELLFNSTQVYKVRKLLRICKDFDIPTTAGTIIVDLLQRVDELEEQVKELTANK